MTEQNKGYPDEWDDIDGDEGGGFAPLPVEDFAFTIESYKFGTSKKGLYQADVTLSITESDGYDGRKLWINCGMEGTTSKGGSMAFGTVQLSKEFVRCQPDMAATLKSAWGELHRDPETGFVGVPMVEDEADLGAWTEYFDLLVGGRVEAHVKQKQKKRWVDNTLVDAKDEDGKPIKDNDIAYFLYKKQ